MSKEKVYTTSEVLHMFGIKKRTLRTWIEDGRITPCLRVRYDEDFFTEEEVARAAQWKYGSKQ